MKRVIFLFLLISFSFFVIAIESDSFRISKDIFSYEIVVGESVHDTLTVKANEQQRIEVLKSGDFISLDDISFNLEKDESKSINISLDSEEFEEGVYVGKITVLGKDGERKILVVLEVQTAFPLFDATIEVPPSSLVGDGGEFLFEVDVLKLKGEQKDVILETFLFDLEGNKVYSESQELEIKQRVKITKSVPIPSSEGSYVFAVLVRDKNNLSIATSTEIIAVGLEKVETGSSSYFSVAVIIIVVLVFVIVLFNRLWGKRRIEDARHWKGQFDKIKNMTDADKQIRRLSRQKNLMGEAYRNRYISKKSYNDGMRSISALIRKLEKRL